MEGHLGARAFESATPSSLDMAPSAAPGRAIGMVIEIGGSSSQVMLDGVELAALTGDPDAAVANAGQVGSQIKMRVGATWLIANVRALKLADGSGDRIAAQVDFLGEGDEERLTGKLYKFRRGVTRYPTPGCPVFPVSTADLKQIYAAEDRAHIEVGSVYPTKNIRAALYVDAMLGKHFALLGSTGTGKSTAAALILHRICELAPQGHIVMVDPHGEYASAFKSIGALYDVGNLQMPYWLMNFEEHCEVFLTTQGSDRQVDADILAKCVLMAKQKNRLAQEIGKLTVDAPIPYLLSDLANIIQLEMGKMDKATDTAPYLRLRSKIDEIKADPRYAFMFSGHAGRGHDGELPRAHLPPARRRQADLDHRRLGRALGDHLGGGGGAQPDGVRFRDLVAQRAQAADPARLRGSAPLRPQRAQRRWLVGRPHPQPDRQGGPQIRRVARADHAAPVGPRRGRALAMRHDPVDAAQQRARPGVRPRGDARGARAASSIRSPRSGIANASRWARAWRRRCGCCSIRSRMPSGPPRTIRSSLGCGARPATRTASSSARSSAGARRGDRRPVSGSYSLSSPSSGGAPPTGTESSRLSRERNSLRSPPWSWWTIVNDAEFGLIATPFL